MTVPMRWLLVGLLISVLALLLVAGAAVRHILRHRRLGSEVQAGKRENGSADVLPADPAPDGHKGD